MTEYYTVKRIDNSRLVRPTSPARLRDFWRRVAAMAALALCLFVYAWQHFECIQMRAQFEQLNERRTQSNVLNQQLMLEVETLRFAGRVETIAKNQLGLTVAIPREAAPAEAPGDPVLAQVRTASYSPRR